MLRNTSLTSLPVPLAALTPAQLRTLRAHESFVAEACAERCVRALENRSQSAASALGELLRAGGPDPAVR